jgi:PPOX class probable F420-dependent enzyme
VSTLDAVAARESFVRARVARLATVAPDGRPHLVPIVFAVDGETIVSAVDAKPKRTTRLRRLANIEVNPAVSLLVDHYDDADWTALQWARADGIGTVLAPDSAPARAALALLAAKYGQYRQQPPPGPVLAIEVSRWSGWSAG